MGVYQDKRTGNWVARSRTVNGKRKYIGTYSDYSSAIRAVLKHDGTVVIKANHQMPITFWQRLKARLGF